MAHLTRCYSCKQPYRCDEPGPRRTSCFDGDDHHFCRPCPNVDCLRGDVASTTMKRLRANPCPECGNFGVSTDLFGGMFLCSLECEASRMLQADEEAGQRFVPPS